jgi:hypothetical protein
LYSPKVIGLERTRRVNGHAHQRILVGDTLILLGTERSHKVNRVGAELLEKIAVGLAELAGPDRTAVVITQW